jgi:hypothetical protein
MVLFFGFEFECFLEGGKGAMDGIIYLVWGWGGWWL